MSRYRMKTIPAMINVIQRGFAEDQEKAALGWGVLLESEGEVMMFVRDGVG
jgi:hypothetical protein